MTEALQQKIQRLEDENAILRRVLHGDGKMPAKWRLTRTEQRFVGALLARQGHVVTYDNLLDALYFDRCGDEPDRDILGVYAMKVRRKLKPHGVTVNTHWGYGLSITVPA